MIPKIFYKRPPLISERGRLLELNKKSEEAKSHSFIFLKLDGDILVSGHTQKY